MKKRYVSILLAAALSAVSLSACGTENSSDTDARLEISDIEDDEAESGSPQRCRKYRRTI